MYSYYSIADYAVSDILWKGVLDCPISHGKSRNSGLILARHEEDIPYFQQAKHHPCCTRFNHFWNISRHERMAGRTIIMATRICFTPSGAYHLKSMTETINDQHQQQHHQHQNPIICRQWNGESRQSLVRDHTQSAQSTRQHYWFQRWTVVGNSVNNDTCEKVLTT